MNISVGLVSATSFRVPSMGVSDTFGRGSVWTPRVVASGAVVDAAGAHPAFPSGQRAAGRLGSAMTTAAKQRRAQSILEQEDALTSLHRAWVAPVQRPVVPSQEPLDEGTIRRRAAGLAREGVRWFEVTSRRRAIETAEEVATHNIGAARTAGDAWVAAEEHRLDAWWNALCGNDPEVVCDHLRTAFQDTDIPAAPISLSGGVLDLAVLIPGEHVLPVDSVQLVGGDLSIRTASAAHRARLHRQLVAGLVIAAARQAFANAPGLSCTRVHAVKATHRGWFDDLSAIARVELCRPHLAGADLSEDAESIVTKHGQGVAWETLGSDGPLRSLPLDDLPELAGLLARLCRGEAAGRGGTGSADGERAPA